MFMMMSLLSTCGHFDFCPVGNLKDIFLFLYIIFLIFLQDLLFARRTFASGEEIRKIYLLHALNHVLKTRTRILKNNAKVRQASENNIEIEYVFLDITYAGPLLISLDFKVEKIGTCKTPGISPMGWPDLNHILGLLQ